MERSLTSEALSMWLFLCIFFVPVLLVSWRGIKDWWRDVTSLP